MLQKISKESPKTPNLNQNKDVLEFAGFELEIFERRLRRGAEIIPLAPKVFDLLVLLAQNPGKLLEKEYLLHALWPDTIVEESNLSVNVSALRKALSEEAGSGRLIETVPKKGYRFLADVQTAAVAAPPLPAPRNKRTHLWVGFIGLLGFVLSGVWIWMYSAPRPKLASVAVLPFTGFQGAQTPDYLGAGMSDAIITRLGKLQKIEVRPASAVARYAGTLADARSAAKELRVDSVVMGHIQQSGERVRVTVQLLDARTSRDLLSETIDDNFTNIFAVQDLAAEKIATALSLHMSETEHKAVSRRSTENTEAYRLFLQGQYLASKRLNNATLEAIEYFQRAIAIDPEYAPPYAAMANSYLLRAGEGWPGDLRDKAKTAALKALSLDDQLPEAHLAVGQVLMRADWDWKGAEKSFRQAVSLNANLPSARAALATLHTALGRHAQAIAEMEAAVQIEPASSWLESDLAWTYSLARKPDQALKAALRAVELDAWSYTARRQASKAYLAKGRFPDAIAHAKTSLEINGKRQRRILAELGKAYAAAGQIVELRAVLDQLQTKSWDEPEPHYELAVLYAGIGNAVIAIRHLNAACDQHLSRVIWAGVDPEFDALRQEPGFRQIIARLGLPQ